MTSLERTRTSPPLPRTAMLVLLAIGPEERHGYAIMQEITRMTDGATVLGPGGIYTTIRRLTDDGLIEETGERPDPELDDQRRRYYRLTATGRAAAAAEVHRLEMIVRSTRDWALEAAG